MSRVRLLFLAALLAACASHLPGHMTLAEMASLNQSGLAHISLGLTKAQVISVMGAEPADTNDGVVNNPWTVEAFTDASGARYEVLFYVTRPNQPFTPVRKSLTTPVVVRNGEVVGWGDDALQRVNH